MQTFETGRQNRGGWQAAAYSYGETQRMTDRNWQASGQTLTDLAEIDRDLAAWS